MQDKLVTSYCLHGENLKLVQQLRDLEMELRDRLDVILVAAEAESAEVTRIITEEGDVVRKELIAHLGIPLDEAQFWLLDTRYIGHGVSFLVLDEKTYREMTMLRKRLGGDTEH